MAVTIRKVTPASRSYGRGRDSYRIPAKYGVFRGGVQVGWITGSNTEYMEDTHWWVDDINGRRLATFYPRRIHRQAQHDTPFKRAKEFALERFAEEAE